MMEQVRLVTRRMNVALYRNVDYVNNKVALHIGSALFNGFTFWMIGHSVSKQQEVLFAVFNFIFVAPGVIAQLQPSSSSVATSTRRVRRRARCTTGSHSRLALSSPRSLT